MSQLMENKNQDVVPEGMCVMHIMDNTGDTRIMWDPQNKDEVDIAKSAWDKAKKKGMTGYSVEGDGAKGEVVRDFDPKRGKVIMVPQLIGG